MADHWETTAPEGARCLLTGASAAANGPYFVCERVPVVFSAVALREIVAAQGSPFVISTKADMEKINAALTDRVAQFDAANARVEELEAQLAKPKPRPRKSDG